MDDGGPAYPRPYSSFENVQGKPDAHNAQSGISLRDAFAIAALQGALANPQTDMSQLRGEEAKKFARGLLYMADLMVKERKKEVNDG